MIKDLKELKALLKLCRAQGVDEITLNGTVIKFGDMPVKLSGDGDQDEPEEPDPLAHLTPEQLMFFSAGSQPPP